MVKYKIALDYYRWVQLTMSEEKRVKTKGAAEILVKRRLGVLKSLVDELNLKLSIKVVPSHKNLADILTRVKKGWLVGSGFNMSICAMTPSIKDCHEAHHFGVERTLYHSRKVDPNVTKADVKAVVRSCERCQSIDPAPQKHVQGDLGVKENWKRLAIDITHYKNKCYLSIVDCGPGRFAIWRHVRNEMADTVVYNLEQIFFERGPVEEVLMDNAIAFRSERMREFLAKWKVDPWYRAAYKPSGNGIVERHHRSVKAIAERADIDPIEAVFWYNISPRTNQDEGSVPQSAIYKYEWRSPLVERMSCTTEEGASLRIGQEVWVKPADARCTTQWKKGRVTNVHSRNNIEVDGMPRHVLDIRPVFEPSQTDDESEQDATQQEIEQPEEEVSPVAQVERRYPNRVRRPPPWLSAYETA